MKRFKRKKRINLNFICFVVIIFILYVTINYIHIEPISKEHKKFITFLLHDTNPYIKSEVNIFDGVYKYLIKIDNPFDVIEKIDEDINDISFAMSETPKVYIYNTHDSEKYLGNEIGVMDAAKLFETKLEEVGIPTLIETGKVTPYLDTSYSTFYQAYAISRKYLESVLENYPNLELIIDLHRDAVEREYSYVTIDGKSYAKVLFVQGVRYDTYKSNLELATSISDKLKERYPGISKGIMLKTQSYQHESYNQDLSQNALLLELGSNNNTWEEINNTIDILVPIIKEVLNEKESI